MKNLEIRNLTKIYNTKKAIDNISMVFPAGEITGIIGFNGSGKTTTYNIISNLEEFYVGDVLLNGAKFQKEDYKKISVVHSGIESKNSDQIINHLKYVGKCFGLTGKKLHQKIAKLVKLVQLEKNLKEKIKLLSKGNQQKIKIISAFLNENTEILLMDEPFDGIDPLILDKIKKYIMQNYAKSIIILTTHRMEIIDEMCTSYYILKNGKIIEYKDKKSDHTIFISTNIETDVSNIKKNSNILNIVSDKEKHIIKVKNLAAFKDVTKLLIKQKGYIHSSLKPRSLTEVVLEIYDKKHTKKE